MIALTIYKLNPFPGVCITSNCNINHVISRGMKRIASNSNLSNLNKQNLFANLTEKTLSIYQSKINTEADFLDRLTHSYQPSENIALQSITYALSPGFSTKKSNIVSSFKPFISPKIEIDNPSQRSNVSFITELATASRYANTSDNILKIKMNSENTQVASNTKSGSNLYSDLTLEYQTPSGVISLLKDIKFGNNMNKITSEVIAEIPYMNSGEVYSIINNPKNLLELSKMRIKLLEESTFDNETRTYTNNLLSNIKNLDPLIDQCHLQYNLLIQEELYKALSIPALRRINMSYYYGILVKECETNPEFFRRLQPYINNHIFDSKRNANLFLARAAIIYHQTVKPILHNIENTRGTSWQASFIDDLKDDIFT